MKVTLSLNEKIWLYYKAECTRRKIKPSREVEKFMQEWLRLWQSETERNKDVPR